MPRHTFVSALLLLSAALPCSAQGPSLTATEIMARVAANQDRAEAERTHYLYVQHARVASRKGKTVQCEEITDTRVTPQEQGSTRTLLKLDGRLLHDGRYVAYDSLPKGSSRHTGADAETGQDKPQPDTAETRHSEEDGDMDRDLVENLRGNLTDDKSKNGLHAGLFPLTSKAQAAYLFTLKGRERRNGVDTFHITFTPRDQDDYGWRGDAWIDATAFQPVVVHTALSKKLPFAVRTLLGTSLPGLGFAATYAAQPDGVWFPITFGGEFKINVFFFFHRTVTLDVENRDFQKTHVESRIVENAPQAAPSER